MDVDAIVVNENEDLISYFALQPNEFAWQNARVREIQDRRAVMSNQLFFDILMQLGGIGDAALLYPPQNVNALQRLLDAVESATFDSMKRDCLIYYLLKWQLDGRELSYADDKCISPHYVALADAYWYLDAGVDLGKAIALFSDARIVKEYPSKIIETLSLSEKSGALIRKFVRTCSPALREQKDLEQYIVALAELSVIEAWQYQRTCAGTEDLRCSLIHKILWWALAPSPRQGPLTQLISIPFSDREDGIVSSFAAQPPSDLPVSSVSILRDMVCVRLIQSCKFIEAVKFDRQFYGTITSGGPKGSWAAERKRVIDGVLSIIPPVERVLLEKELRGISPSTSQPSSQQGPSGSGSSWTNLGSSISTELGMSWDDLGPQRLSNRKPFAAPRTSLPNGISTSLFTPGASTSSGHAQPLSAQPTLVSQTSSNDIALQQSFRGFASQATSTSRAIFTVVSSKESRGPLLPDGSGTPKRNAFTARNAFFEPPEADREGDRPLRNGKQPEQVNGKQPASVATQRQKSPIRLQSETPPRREGLEESVHDKQPEGDSDIGAMEDEQHFLDADQASVSAEGEDASAMTEKDDVGYSIFSASGTVGRPPPKATQGSPVRKGRVARSVSEQEQRALPGAFVSDDDDTEQPHQLSNSRAQASQKAAQASSKTQLKRTSRKRAASPDESADNIKVNIPGTLFEEAEESEGQVSSPLRGLGHDSAVSDNESEEADRLAPLPTTRRAPRTSSTGAKKVSRARSSRSSRASSIEPGDIDEDANKPVRRSSRLSTTSAPTSPDTSQATKKTASGRPRKSTRTAKDGATATGKGATRRR